jgi:steroid 5-alpha reductase family enzyme
MEYLNMYTSPLFLSLGVMFVAYLIAVRYQFYSLVDAVWAFLFTPIVMLNALAGQANPLRNAILVFIVTLWSMRLGVHLTKRLKSHFPTEDSRYVDLRNKWSKNLKINFLLFYLFQGLTVVILSMPFLLIAMNQDKKIQPLEFLGVALWCIGIIGEAIADMQLSRFRQQPENKGKVCEVGLWQYSRHPNYFFEWVIWLGYAFFALSSDLGVLGFLSPIIMLVFLLKVTGVPYAEAMSLKSRGDLYRDYQKRVSVFVPWFPKKAP